MDAERIFSYRALRIGRGDETPLAGQQVVVSGTVVGDLPGFDGWEALRLIQACGQDLPFIVVSGVIGEDDADMYAAAVEATSKLLPPVNGGVTRQQSVLNGLEASKSTEELQGAVDEGWTVELALPWAILREADRIAEDYFTVENGRLPIRDRDPAERADASGIQDQQQHDTRHHEGEPEAEAGRHAGADQRAEEAAHRGRRGRGWSRAAVRAA